MTADDAQASSSTVLINGTAQGTYNGYLVKGTITNVRITKRFCGAPSAGYEQGCIAIANDTVRPFHE